MVKLSSALTLVPFLFSAASFATEVGACPAPPNVVARAVYFLSNEKENSVVSLKVNSDGTLSDGSITKTGGAGGAGVDADGNPAGPDPLFSQGSIATSGSYLAAVNPGSKSLSIFHIDKEDPTMLTMIGEPVDTMGDFPVTVALSAHLSQACVVNGGAKAGVACFEITDEGACALDRSLRSFDLGQTTPPSGTPNTVSQAHFDEESSALLVYVKGNPNTNNTGFVSVFPVEDGTVSHEGIKSSPDGTTLLFGTVQVPGTPRFVATDPSVGGALLEVNPKDGKFTTVTVTEIPDQMATCWAAYSGVADSVFVTDGAVNRLVGIDPATGKIASDVTFDNGNGGMLDIVAIGDFAYALAAGGDAPTVVVLDVSGDKVKHVQNFQPGGVTDALRIQGMAVCD